MIGSLGLICLFLNIIVLLRDRDRGIILYCILVMTAPVTVLFGYSIKYDIVSLPLLLYILLTKRSRKICFASAHIVWIIWFIWLLMITMISPYLRIPGSKIEWISIIGLARYFFVYFILTDEKIIQMKFVSIMRYITYINIIAVALQYCFSRIFSGKWVLDLMLQLYGTIGNSGALSADAAVGKLTRYYGTFSSTSLLGTFSILGMVLFFVELWKKTSWVNILSFVFAAILGVASSTKRFYLGIVAMSIYYIAIVIYLRKGRIVININKMAKILSLMSVTCVLLIGFSTYFIDSSVVKYYSSFLLQGKFIQAFETRFSSTGAVNAMRKTIHEYFITGVGTISTPGIHTTDSQLYVTLYWTGVIGLLLTLILLWKIFLNVVDEKALVKFMVFGVVAFEFIISTQFYSSMGIFFLIYLTGGLNLKATKYNAHYAIKI